MRVLFDTNVVLDLLLDREPFADDASGLTQMVERGELVGVLGATTITTVFYIAEKARSSEEARKHIGSLLRLFEVAPVTRSVLEAACQAEFSDFEDAVLHEAGKDFGIDALVTRDTAGFARAQIPVFTPGELLAALLVSEGETTSEPLPPSD